MRKLRSKEGSKGQIRIIEALLASIILLLAITFVNIFAATPSSPKYDTGELEKIGHNVLHDIDEQRLLARYIYNEEWANITAALMVSVPTDVYFNLTVYDMEGNVINPVPIQYGAPQIFVASSSIASVVYIVPGYQTNYQPRILILQLVRG